MLVQTKVINELDKLSGELLRLDFENLTSFKRML